MSFIILVAAELEEKYKFNSCSIWREKTYKKNREPYNGTFLLSNSMFIHFGTSRYCLIIENMKANYILKL